MSSWKKAAKSHQKVHRERHQPEARKHFGLLEKKNDYKTRARNTQAKEKTLKLLQRKALNKNPDEFYHHMINSKLHDGVHHEKEEKDEHTKEQKALMETQDLKYIKMKRTMESKKINRLQSQLHMIDMANNVVNKHVFFVDDDEKNFNEVDLANKLDTHPSLLERRTNRPKLENLQKQLLPELTPQEIQHANALKEKSYQELSKRIEREKELAIVQQKLELKRMLQKPRLLQPKKIKKGTKNAPPEYFFKYERKK